MTTAGESETEQAHLAPAYLLGGYLILISFGYLLLAGRVDHLDGLSEPFAAAMQWWPTTDIAFKGICAANGGGFGRMSLQFSGTGSSWQTTFPALAWISLLGSAVSALWSPHRARRLMELSLVLSTLGTTLYGVGWFEAALESPEGLTRLESCELSRPELLLLSDRSSYIRAILPQLFATVALPLLTYFDQPGVSRSLRPWWREHPSWWARAAVALFALISVPPVIVVGAIGIYSKSEALAIWMGLPVFFLLLLGSASLLTDGDLRRAGGAAILTAAGLALTGYVTVEVILLSNRHPADDLPLRYEIDLPQAAQDNLREAQGYLAGALAVALWLAACSFLSGRLLLTKPRARRVTSSSEPLVDLPGTLPGKPIVLLVGGKAGAAMWLAIQQFAWAQGWRTTVSRQVVRDLLLRGETVLFIDFSASRRPLLHVGRVQVDEPGKSVDGLSFAGDAVAANDDGSISGERLAARISHLQAAGSTST